MAEQLQLEMSEGDIIARHGMELRVDHATFDPDDCRVIGFMRRYLDESPREARHVWVISPHTRGQVRMYVLGDGVLRHTYPDYAGDWPELDNAVAARLEAALYSEIAWGPTGPRENWREDLGGDHA